MNGEVPKESPVLELPSDGQRVERLRRKLNEYQSRLDPAKAPETQMDTICKIRVLELLLQEGKVVTWDLSRQLGKEYGGSFDPEAFQNACGVIADYYSTGGQNVSGGTGLMTA